MNATHCDSQRLDVAGLETPPPLTPRSELNPSHRREPSVRCASVTSRAEGGAIKSRRAEHKLGEGVREAVGRESLRLKGTFITVAAVVRDNTVLTKGSHVET
ncbi:hypothetical protein EYF80_027947 [Liparis tanakae]|uniref:Uncharacterized protein n=1 Tax=Liparis tanakae TaxID=230148 RepID=A0A4Z2H8I0_9TELE|nr:hypothetical protein EYF80_027947 [Liparis tanakae]